MLTTASFITAVVKMCAGRSLVNAATKPLRSLMHPREAEVYSGPRLTAIVVATRASGSSARRRQSERSDMQPDAADTESLQQAACVGHATQPGAGRRRRRVQQQLPLLDTLVLDPLPQQLQCQSMLTIDSGPPSQREQANTAASVPAADFSHSTASSIDNSTNRAISSSQPATTAVHHRTVDTAPTSSQELASSSSTSSDDVQHLQPKYITSSTDSSNDPYDFVGRNSDEVIAAIGRITRFLDFRERCASEVLTKLQTLGYSKDLASQVLTALQQSDIQNDARFAEGFVRSYWRSKAQSPSRLAYELRSRGVSQKHIDAALSTAFGDTRQLPTSEPGSEAEEQSWEHLLEVCRRKVEYTSSEPAQKRRAKLAGWLQRQGHSMSTVFRVFGAIGI